MAAVASAFPDTWTTESWPALGTTAVLRFPGGSGRHAVRTAQREIEAIDAAASRFRPDSELSRLNAAAGRWREVSPLFLEAVRLALRAAWVSDGAVDPTLGESLIKAGYDRDWNELSPAPSGPAPRRSPRLVLVRRRMALWHAIGLREEPPMVRLPAGVSLDLGATAKALAADRAVAAVHRAAGTAVLVALGGDVATAGPAPGGGWMVHVTDDHRAGPLAPGQTVSIRSGGLATSSTVARRWLHRGQVMHHILDPRTGQPVTASWRTVSVAAASCAEANIAATSAIVLGDDAPEWLAEQNLPARLVTPEGTVRVQGGWPT